MKFPPRQGGRAVTQVNLSSLVSSLHPQADRVEYLEGNSRRSQRAMKLETAAGCNWPAHPSVPRP